GISYRCQQYAHHFAWFYRCYFIVGGWHRRDEYNARERYRAYPRGGDSHGHWSAHAQYIAAVFSGGSGGVYVRGHYRCAWWRGRSRDYWCLDHASNVFGAYYGASVCLCCWYRLNFWFCPSIESCTVRPCDSVE